MEVDVIFTHELIQPDVSRVEPPLLPFRGIVGRDTRVSDRSVELDEVK
jgi:hypothetical protein